MSTNLQSRKKKALGTGIALTSILLLTVGASAAQAATTYYAWKVSTPEGVARISAVPYFGINGGEALSDINFGGGTVIITYQDQPGYREYGFAEGSNGHWVTLTHSLVTNTKSRCFYTVLGAGGSVNLSCGYYS